MAGRVYETFVKCPGIIEIRWQSDDPDFVCNPDDLYNWQAKGIPEDYGKKDKKTTKQAIFYCLQCECPSASLKTLRAHCEGTQHKRKAEQTFQLKQRKNVSPSDLESTSDKSLNNSRHDIRLKELCRQREVVGLQYVEEYMTKDRLDPPIYMCTIKA
jgi:hypothetical protein